MTSIKKVPYYNFKEDIMSQLHGHYIFYKTKNKPIEREIIKLLAEIILTTDVYTLPSDFLEYVPLIKLNYKYEGKNKNNWMTQFKMKDISYILVNTNNKEIINQVLLLSENNYENIHNISFMFFKYEDSWIFPTHCWAMHNGESLLLKFLNNKRCDKKIINKYNEIGKNLIINSLYFVDNKKIKNKIRTKKGEDFVPEIFYDCQKPSYKNETLKKFELSIINDQNNLKLFAKNILK